QNRRSGVLRTRRKIGDRGPLLPLGDRPGIDPVPLGKRPQALLTLLYRSTDCLCRRGAPMKNLAHSASFESLDKIAPSKPETKQLSRALRWLPGLAGFGVEALPGPVRQQQIL